MKRNISIDICQEYFEAHTAALTREAKAKVLAAFMELTGLSKSAAYARFSEIRRGASIVAVASGRRRGGKELSDADRKELYAIASMKVAGLIDRKGREIVNGSAIRTLDAIHLCEQEGLIMPGRWKQSTTDRWLRKLGLSAEWFKRARANSVAWKAHHPLQIVMIDASPLNCIYLRLEKEDVISRPDLFTSDTHFVDTLRRDRLEKIWVWYYVDIYSGAFHVRAFPGPGEKTVDCLNFLAECILPKPSEEDNPLEGVPHFLYSDRGSAIWSNATRNFMSRLGVHMEHHLPGNPRAKGRVEGMIGAYKRRFESLLNLVKNEHISSIDKLNYYLQGFCRQRNRERGTYDLFREGALKTPIRRATIDNIRDASQSMFTKSINAYGCIKVDGKERYVSNRLFVGQKVDVFRNLQGEMIAEDPVTGKMYEVQEDGRRYVTPVNDKGEIEANFEHQNESKVEWSEGTEAQGREAARREAKMKRGEVNLLSIPMDRTEQRNVSSFPVPGENIETQSVIGRESFSTVDDAIIYLYHITGIKLTSFRIEFQDELRNSLEQLIEIADFITPAQLIKVGNKMQDKIREMRESQET